MYVPYRTPSHRVFKLLPVPAVEQPNRFPAIPVSAGAIPVTGNRKKSPGTANLINIFFFIKVQPLPDSRHYVVPWAIQNSAMMKKCS